MVFPQIRLPWLPTDLAPTVFVDLNLREGGIATARANGVEGRGVKAGGRAGERPGKMQKHLGRGGGATF